MALLFTYTPNLQTVALELGEMNTYFSCLEALNQRTLRRLELEVSKWECVAHKMLPLLSGLEELRLTGNTSSWTTSIPRDRLPLPGTIWRLTKLRIHCLDATILQYCPELRELEIYWLRSIPDDPPALREILTCTKLEALTFRSFDRFPRLQDLPELLTSLRGLKRLALSAHSVAEVEFLCALDGHATLPGNVAAQMTENSADCLGSWYGNENKVLPLPLLEHLSIAAERLPMNANNSSRLHLALSRILKSRPALKTIVVQGLRFDPRRLSMEDWVCKDLETLSLEFPRSLRVLPDAARQGLWRHVYRQIGSLSKLKSLMLCCADVEIGADSGIEALAEASGLERLALVDALPATCTIARLWQLLQIFPKLSALCLFRDDKLVTEWLKESDRRVEHLSYRAMRRLVETNAFP
ncbi:hypothetical protein BGZ72_001375 [Mortierella alpina]|nr:hypothetical protein BGZ72_001375 [Mortierella alpina]